MDQPKITVILPIYNTGIYLSRCLESVLGQTFREFEVLCIDDGSSDGSDTILDGYASLDSRVRVIHLPENHGVPFARNLAMEEAHGEYIYFMDSDDWIDSNYLEEMYRHAVATGQNVVINSNWIFEYDDPAKNKKSGKFDSCQKEAGYYSPAIVQSKFLPVVWARLYRLDYLKRNDIKSPVHIKCGVEDNYFTSMAEILQERSYIFCGPFYHYYQREGSLSRGEDVTINYFLNFRHFLNSLRERGIAPERARRFYVLDTFEITEEREEKFNFIRDYFTDVRPDVLACPDLYDPFDAFAMEAVLSCTNIAEFQRLFLPNLHHYFNIQYIRRKHYPTTAQVLDGKW